MTRRRCCGYVDIVPCCRRFIPESNPQGDSVTLLIEELEALRLKDLLGFDQGACAEVMGFSRATYQRVLWAARAKVARALVEGQEITIEGGNYVMKNRIFECKDCGEKWEVEPCTDGGKHGYEIPCPRCGSVNKLKIGEDGTKIACGGGHHRGHGAGGCCCGGHRG